MQGTLPSNQFITVQVNEVTSLPKLCKDQHYLRVHCLPITCRRRRKYDYKIPGVTGQIPDGEAGPRLYPLLSHPLSNGGHCVGVRWGAVLRHVFFLVCADIL